ncbi:Zn-dependent hydrolase [Amphibacillus cookii]|uniref:Zn-dependent hydrolase n=1 Tax=Amphibacillus cookii TaxID=767787 RepID=UPI0019561236|nr:Zn-dependent hydrolase [Amphibacillus cookii]MBM7541307.1 allantoate deiminase [Amphibacillus cookii]
MEINSTRLWSRINELGQIGKDQQGGLTRLAFTEQEHQAKQLLTTYMEGAGLEVREDQIGNLFGKIKGTDPNARTILIGSHIDTVFNGGIFDGAAGVLIGIEVLQSIKQQKLKLTNDIEVVAFTDEEGARFSSGMIGSQAFIGALDVNDLYAYTDQFGISIAEAMKQQGYLPEHVSRAKVDPEKLACYLEVHIEQGKILESKQVPVGLVTGIVGLRWLKIKLHGEAGHAGTTPMHLRKDPLACAAEMIQAVETLAKAEQATVATVGQIKVKPGGINVIPSEVEFTIDLRDLSDPLLDKLVDRIRQDLKRVATKRGITADCTVIEQSQGVKTSETINHAIASAIAKQNLETVELPSGAGHDAMVVAQITDVGMIFLRTKNGISHTPEEWADKDDLAMGAQVIFDTVKYLDLQNNG